MDALAAATPFFSNRNSNAATSVVLPHPCGAVSATHSGRVFAFGRSFARFSCLCFSSLPTHHRYAGT